MSEFVESNVQGTCMFGIEKQCTKFGIGGACQDWSHDLTEHINGSIVWWWVIGCCWQGCRLGTKKMVSVSMGVTFGGQ